MKNRRATTQCEISVEIQYSFFLFTMFPEQTEMDLLSVITSGLSHFSTAAEGSCLVFGSHKTPAVFSLDILF